MRAEPRIVVTSLVLAMAGIVGCEQTISEKETVTHKRDGTVKVDRETVKERSDGTRVYEKETDVDRDRDVDRKIEVDVD